MTAERVYNEYVALGWSCFPVQARGKRPLFKWEPYQHRPPREDEIAAWVQEYAGANVAVATGKVSGVIVVDVDSADGLDELQKHGFIPPTVTCKTSKGWHYYFKHPGTTLGNKASFVPGVDLRADGGYVIAPPSVHETGHVYTWERAPGDVAIAPVPEWLLLLINKPRQPVTTGQPAPAADLRDAAEHWLSEALGRAFPGSRDDVAFWLACQLRDDGLSYAEAERVLVTYAARVPQGDDPYTEKEARAKVRSAWKEPARERAMSQQRIERGDVALYAEDAWYDPEGASVPVGDEAPQEQRKAADKPVAKTKPKPRPFVTTDEAYANLLSELLEDPDAYPDVTPYDFPVKALWELGGFARYAWPAKMVYVCGGAGFLKTTFAEFMQDNLLKAGYDFAHFGPEWTPDEMAIRGVQRYGGVSLDDMAANRVHFVDERNGAVKPRGKGLTYEQQKASIDVIAQRLEWKGRGYYIPGASLTLPKLIEATVEAVQDSRNRGREFKAVFWDYLEIMRRFATSTDVFWGERLATVLKNLSIDYGFTAYLLLQAKKGAADRVREAVNDNNAVTDVLLGAADAQGITDQQCNLFITLNPKFDRERRITNDVMLNVVKNSGGSTGQVPIKVNPRLLQFMDKK